MPFIWATAPSLITPEPDPIPSSAISYKVDAVANTVNTGGSLLYNTSTQQYDVVYPSNVYNVVGVYTNTFTTLNSSYANITTAVVGNLQYTQANITTLNIVTGTINSAYINVFYSPLILNGVVSADPTAPLGIASKQYVDALPVGGGANVGQIARFAQPTLPNTWLKTYQTASRNTYNTLFEHIGTRYGSGDGVNTFALPGVTSPVASVTPFMNINPPLNRQQHVTLKLSDNRIVMIGGYDGSGGRQNTLIGVFHGNNISWVESTPLPNRIADSRGVVLTDGRIMITGGYNYDTLGYHANVYFGTVSSNTIAWSAGTAFPTSRGAHTLTQLNDGRVILVGGYNGGAISNTLFGTISGASVTWNGGTDLPAGRYYHGAIELDDGRLFVGTGSYSGSTNNYIGTISGTTIDWQVATFPPQGITAYAATKIPGNRILMTGGSNTVTSAVSLTTLVGEFANGSNVITWVSNKRIPASLVYGSVYSQAVLLHDNSVYVTGRSVVDTFGLGYRAIVTGNTISWAGYTRAYHTITYIGNNTILLAGGYDSVNTYSNVFWGTVNTEVQTISWGDSNTVQLPGIRFRHSMTLLNDGRLLLVGGTGTLTAHSNVYLGTIGNQTIDWVESTTLGTGRYAHETVQLPTGQILVIGGYTGAGALANVAIGSISGNAISWHVSANNNLPLSIYHHSACVLRDGRVLITGGLDSGGIVRDTVYFGQVLGNGVIWTSGTTPLSIPQCYHKMITLYDGRVLYLGGETGSGRAWDITISSVPPSELSINWKSAIPQAIRQGTLTGTAQVDDGTVVSVGGYNETGIRNDAQFIKFFSIGIKT